MATSPTRPRVRRTSGSKRLEDFINRHGLRPVTVYIPEPLHRAMSHIAIEADTTLQGLLTLACNKYYGQGAEVPPLVAPTRTKTDPHKSCTWYADIDIHRTIKKLAVDMDCSAQQLILSAVVNSLKDNPLIKELGIETGYAPYAQAPKDDTPLVRA